MSLNLEQTSHGQLERLVIAADVAEALKHMHHCGWAHRDIKPHNVLVENRGRAKLTDLGTAARIGKDVDFGVSESEPVGTSGYTAPEILAAELHGGNSTHSDSSGGAAADVFSSGVLLWEVMIGVCEGDGVPTKYSNPFTGRAADDVLRRLNSGERWPLHPVFHQLEEIRQLLQVCWAIDPSERPSAALLHHFLANLVKQVSSKEEA